MNKKFLYKLLLIFALLACALLISNTKTFAAVSEDNLLRENISFLYNDVEVTYSDTRILSNYKNIAIIDVHKSTSTGLPYFRVLFSNADIIGFYPSGNYFYVAAFNFDGTPSSELIGISDTFVLNRDNTFSEPMVVTWYNSGTYSLHCGGSVEGEYTFIYGDSNVYSINTSFELGENVLFQQPPQVMEQAGTLAPIVEGVEAKKTLAEVVGILPIILVVVVGLLAMRKAIAFLMRTLKQG